MAGPGKAVAAPIFEQQSLTPLLERVSNTLDYRATRDRREKEVINKQFAEEISSIDYNGLTTDQIDNLKNRTNALIDLNATMIRNAAGDPRSIDRKAILREQNSIRAIGDKWRKFDQEISTVSKTVEADEDGIYDKAVMNNALIGMTYETLKDGTRQAREDVETGAAIAMLDNPAFMDPDAYIKREINKLDEITTKEFETQSGIPGFGTMGFGMQQKTNIPWQIDPNTEQPKINPDTGEKMLDMDAWAQIVLNDPNTRKHIQHFAAQSGVTVNEWLYQKGLEHNATPKTLEQVYYPRIPRATAASLRRRESDDVKKVFLDTISGLLNQSPELVRNLPQAAELDEDNVPYRDATEILQPYALTKVGGKALPFAKVYLKDGEPGSFFVKETEDADLRTMTEAEVTNMVNAAGTLNTALRGIDSYAIQQGYVTGQNVFNPNVNIMQDPLFLKERGQLRTDTIVARQQSQTQLKELAEKVREKSGFAFMGGDQTKFTKEINAVLKGKTINVPGLVGRTETIKDPIIEVDVLFWNKNEIIIKGGRSPQRG